MWAWPNDFKDFTPWPSDGAARLRAAATELADAAVLAHPQTTASIHDDSEISSLWAANDRLLPAVLTYADAQSNHTGNSFPFGIVRSLVDEEEDEPEAESGAPAEPPAAVSVLQRRDYPVTDETTVLAARRAAYRRTTPDQDEASATARVTHLGLAMYELAHAHADGWDQLGHTQGLTPAGAWIAVVGQDDPLGPNADDWPDDPLDFNADLLFELSETYH